VYVCLSVCVCALVYLENYTTVYFIKLGLIFLPRRCDTLFTFGFVDDVMLSHNGFCVSCVCLHLDNGFI